MFEGLWQDLTGSDSVLQGFTRLKVYLYEAALENLVFAFRGSLWDLGYTRALVL